MFDLDLPAIYRKISCSTLLIGADKDLQCDPGDFFIVKELCGGPARVKVFPDLTHLLRFDDHEPTCNRYQELTDKPVEQ